MYRLSFSYIKEKWAHEGFQKYFRNTGWMFAGQMTMIISLFINIWIARHLGPTHFGSLSYIFAFVGIFSFIANLGIQDVLIRDLVKFPEEKEKIAGTAIRLLGFAGVIAFLIVSIASLLVNGATLITLLVILYATIFLWSPTMVIPAYFQSVVQSKQNALIQIIGTIVVSALKAYLIFTDKGIIWLTGAFALDYVIGGILYIWTYKKLKLTFINLSAFDWTFAKNILSASWLLMISGGLSYILFKADQVLVKQLLDEASLGFYAVAVKLSEVWYFIPGIICSSLFPAIINAKITNEEIYRNRLKKLSLFLILISTGIAIFISVSALWLVPLLFGVVYTPSILATQIYAWSGIGYFLIVATTKYLMTENRFFEIALYMLIAATINVLLNILLIPTIGLSGAAIASVISYAIFPILTFARRSPLPLQNL